MPPRRRAPAFSRADIEEAVAGDHEITGFAATNDDQHLYLKLAFSKGRTATFWLEPVQAHNLLRHLRELLGDTAATPTFFQVPPHTKSYGVFPEHDE
jgi:hypothetical protein